MVEDLAIDGPTCRLMSALVRFGPRPAGTPDRSSVSLAGAAWRGERGNTLWGWPDEAGEVGLRESVEPFAACASLPPALSLALSLRRAKVGIGARGVIVGSGTMSRIARAVAAGCGCRLGPDGIGGMAATAGGAEPDLVIVATDDAEALKRALTACRSWGDVFSFGDALRSGPLDYYSEIHRRALAVHSVPLQPRLLPGEKEIVERGASNLARALAGTPRPAGPTVPATDRRGVSLGEVATDEDTAWGLLETKES